jgi:hypothetical protein
VSSSDGQIATGFYHEVPSLRLPDDAVMNSAVMNSAPGGCRGAMAGGPLHVADHPGLPSISERPQPRTDPAPTGTDDVILTYARELTAEV